MKTLTFALIFCFVSLSILSQENNSKISLGLSFNPHLSDKTYRLPPGYENLEDYFDDHFKLGWTTGVLARRQIADKYSLQSGIYLSNKGSANHYHFQLSDTIRDLLLAEEGRYPEETYSKSYDYFIDIPLTLNYILHNGRELSYYTRFGLITNIYVAFEGFYKTDFNDGSQSIRYMHLNHKQLKEDYIIKMINLSGVLVMGIEYSINSNFGLFIEPNFDMSIFPLYNSDDFLIEVEKPRYYNIGLSVGFLIH